MDPKRLSHLPVDSHGQPMRKMARHKAKQEKVIPKGYEDLIPSGAMSISSLLNTPLPTILSAASSRRPANSCLVSEPPNWTKGKLKTVQAAAAVLNGREAPAKAKSIGCPSPKRQPLRRLTGNALGDPDRRTVVTRYRNKRPETR